jgi:hypothetical protein
MDFGYQHRRTGWSRVWSFVYWSFVFAISCRPPGGPTGYCTFFTGKASRWKYPGAGCLSISFVVLLRPCQGFLLAGQACHSGPFSYEERRVLYYVLMTVLQAEDEARDVGWTD